MALATRCPNCRALFRVAAEQLKTHGGMVRCGSCRHVFNAIECLDYLDPQHPAAADPPPRHDERPTAAYAGTGKSQVADAASARASLHATRSHAPEVRLPAAGQGAHSVPPQRAGAAAFSARPSATAGTTDAGVRPQALAAAPRPSQEAHARVARMPTRAIHDLASVEETPGVAPLTVMGPITEGPQGNSAPSFDHLFPLQAPTASEPPRRRAAPVGATFEAPPREIDGNESASSRGAARGPGDEADSVAEPDFLRPRHVEPMSRGSRIAIGIASGLLSLTLAAEVLLFFRTSFIVHFPETRPVMNALCVPLGCTAQWPMRPEFLAVVSSELQAVPGTDGMELDALIRNRAAFPMALPAIELTITDSRNQPVARKVFLPADYQKTRPDATTPVDDSIPAESDLPVRILFELPGAGASGFIAYPFYP